MEHSPRRRKSSRCGPPSLGCWQDIFRISSKTCREVSKVVSVPEQSTSNLETWKLCVDLLATSHVKTTKSFLIHFELIPWLGSRQCWRVLNAVEKTNHALKFYSFLVVWGVELASELFKTVSCQPTRQDYEEFFRQNSILVYGLTPTVTNVWIGHVILTWNPTPKGMIHIQECQNKDTVSEKPR